MLKVRPKLALNKSLFKKKSIGINLQDLLNDTRGHTLTKGKKVSRVVAARFPHSTHNEPRRFQSCTSPRLSISWVALASWDAVAWLFSLFSLFSNSGPVQVERSTLSSSSKSSTAVNLRSGLDERGESRTLIPYVCECLVP